MPGRGLDDEKVLSESSELCDFIQAVLQLVVVKHSYYFSICSLPYVTARRAPVIFSAR